MFERNKLKCAWEIPKILIICERGEERDHSGEN